MTSVARGSATRSNFRDELETLDRLASKTMRFLDLPSRTLVMTPIRESTGSAPR